MLFVSLSNFQHQQLAPFVGNYERKVIAPAKKVVSAVENSEDHSIQEQMAKMMAMVETSAQQVAATNRALEESRAKLTARITELQQENQFLKETERKMKYDPCNPRNQRE